jgi:hypothetical protein
MSESAPIRRNILFRQSAPRSQQGASRSFFSLSTATTEVLRFVGGLAQASMIPFQAESKLDQGGILSEIELAETDSIL